MGVYHDKKIILLHPPKTGGTSLAHFIGNGSNGNLYPEEIKDKISVLEWEEYTALMTVREPFARFVSGWKFFGAYKRGESFPDYLARMLAPDASTPGRIEQSQTRWLPADKDVLVYKCEELYERFPGIRTMRVTSGPTWQDVWTPELGELVVKERQEDYERFQYEPPKP
jgi:hypothetical protein